MNSRLISVFRQWRDGAATLAGCGLLLWQSAITPWLAPALHAAPAAPQAGLALTGETRKEQLAARNLAQLPVTFEQNIGQHNQRILYSARSGNFALSLTQTEAWLMLPGKQGTADYLRMSLVNGNPQAEITPLTIAPGVTHYYSGKDQSKWVRNVHSYAQVQYREVYPGIDLIWYSQGRELEYDFIVAPGADPRQIVWQYSGADEIRLNASGDLLLKTKNGELTQHAPIVYQTVNGVRHSIEGNFRLEGESRISFSIGNYDKTLPLIIDPRIGYSTYFGGSRIEHFTSGVAINDAGEAFLGGFTFSGDLPGTVPQSTIQNLFVARLNAQGTAPIYTVVMDEGSFVQENGLITAIAVDSNNNAYITGRARGKEFPTVNAFQDRDNPGLSFSGTEYLIAHDAFVTKLDPTGTIVFSTFLGGGRDDEAYDIAVTSAGRVAITGFTNSRNFPKQNQFQGNILLASGRDIFISVFEADGQSLQYSTYLRGGDINDEEGRGIAVDAGGNVYVTGFSAGNRLPTGQSAQNVFQPERSGGRDAFAAKFNPALSGESSLIFCTYLGGGGTDEGSDIAVDSSGNVYVTGITGSSGFPLQAAAGSTIIDSTNQVNEAFVTAFNPTASALLFSTFLGGSGLETNQTVSIPPPTGAEELTLRGTGRIALDGQNNIYVTGVTESNDFPVLNAVQKRPGGAQDMFLTKLASGGTRIIYSTYWGGAQREFPGGLAVDRQQNVFVSGNTASQDFPTTAGTLQPESPGESNYFVTKFGNPNADTIGVYNPALNRFFLRNSNTVGVADLSPVFGQAGDIPVIGDWNGDGVETIGVFRQGTYLLSNSNTNPTIDLTLPVGVPGDLPLTGDWDGDGDDTAGVQRGNLMLLTNDNTLFSIGFQFGNIGDIALSGDWDGDGVDTVGVFRQGTFFLTNVPGNGIAEIEVAFGQATDLPVVGDWDGDGSTTIGVYRPGGRLNSFLLRNSNTSGSPDLTLNFSRVAIPATGFEDNGLLPVAGDYNGLP